MGVATGGTKVKRISSSPSAFELQGLTDQVRTQALMISLSTPKWIILFMVPQKPPCASWTAWLCCSSHPSSWGWPMASSDQQSFAEGLLCDFQGQALLPWDNSRSGGEAPGGLLEEERHVEGEAQLAVSTHHQPRERGCQPQAAPADLTGRQTRG